MAEEIKETESIQEEEKPEISAKTYTEQEYQALQIQLDELKKSASENEDYKQKWEKSEQARKDFERKTQINSFVKSLGLRDDIYEKYVADLIASKDLKFENEKLIGGEDVVNDFKNKYPNAFKSSEPVPEFSVKTTGANAKNADDSLIRAVMGIK